MADTFLGPDWSNPFRLAFRRHSHQLLAWGCEDALPRIKSVESNQDQPMRDSSVFDGIPMVLGRLSSRWPLVVVSNKPSALARAVLEEAGLLSAFASVHGADAVPQRKPSPLLLRQAAARLGVATGALLMVGDAGTDIEAALAAECHAAWAAWGYGQADGQAPSRVWPLRTPHDLLVRMADAEH